jgi:hypothetical protein
MSLLSLFNSVLNLKLVLMSAFREHGHRLIIDNLEYSINMCHWRSVLSQEPAHDFQISFLLLKNRRVAALRKLDPLDLRDFLEERKYSNVLCFIVLAVDQQRWGGYLVKTFHDGPIFQRPGDIELGGPNPELSNVNYTFRAKKRINCTHGGINGGIFVDGSKCVDQDIGPGFDDTNVLFVEFLNALLIC